MKKILTTLIAGAILAITASADFSRIEAGAGAWIQTPSGELSYADGPITGSDVSNETEETSAYVWMLIKHPVPILPNIRLEYASVESVGQVEGEFEDFDINLPIGETTQSILEMTQ